MSKSILQLKLQLAGLGSKTTTLKDIVLEQKKLWDFSLNTLNVEADKIHTSLKPLSEIQAENQSQAQTIKKTLSQTLRIKKHYQQLIKEPTQHLKSLESLEHLKNGRLEKLLVTVKEKYPKLDVKNIENDFCQLEKSIQEVKALLNDFMKNALQFFDKLDSLHQKQQQLYIPIEIQELSRMTHWLTKKFDHLTTTQDTVISLRQNKPLLFRSLNEALDQFDAKTTALGFEHTYFSTHPDSIEVNSDLKSGPKL